MLVGTHQKTAEADELVIEISNKRLERVKKFKYLGVLLDNTLYILEGPRRMYR